MYCPNCGKKVDDSYNFCPLCQFHLENYRKSSYSRQNKEVEVINKPTNFVETIALILGLIGLLLAILPFSKSFAVLGSIFGLIAIVVGTYNKIANDSKHQTFVLVLATTVILTNLGWYFFLDQVVTKF